MVQNEIKFDKENITYQPWRNKMVNNKSFDEAYIIISLSRNMTSQLIENNNFFHPGDVFLQKTYTKESNGITHHVAFWRTYKKEHSHHELWRNQKWRQNKHILESLLRLNHR